MSENVTQRKPDEPKNAGLANLVAKAKAASSTAQKKNPANSPRSADPVTIANAAARKAIRAEQDKPATKAAPRKKKAPAKDPGNTGNEGAKDKPRARSRKKAPVRMDKAGKPMPVFDVSTRAGRRSRLEWMAAHGIDTAARQAIKDLEEMDREEQTHDPNAKTDPAEVCAYLARCNLYGLDPVKVLHETHGPRKVLAALAQSLGFTSISVVLGDTLHHYPSEGQCLQAFATDAASVALSDEPAPGGEETETDPPPGANT